jgi:hypothetical protein
MSLLLILLFIETVPIKHILQINNFSVILNIFLFRFISSTCSSTLRAKNETPKAFFAITGFVLVGNFSPAFAYAVFWHYKPPDLCLGMYCRVRLRRRLLLLLVSSELILVSSLPVVPCPTRFTRQLPKLPRTS